MPNALADEKSPYLLQHADNPVEWLPWGETAFAKARAEQKPIFLSIGYSTCHWCHVMAHESFENPAIAAVLNRDFIPVKVDREERPDIDRVYMTYVQAVTGHGGWPLSVWITPELKPFYGGTYFPPEDRQGRPGLPSILGVIARGWHEDRASLTTEAERVTTAIRQHYEMGVSGRNAVSSEPGTTLVEAASAAFEKGFQYFYESFDSSYGGFGGAPKFPRASNLNFLFRVAALQGRDSELGSEAVSMAVATLQAMARGGIHDHVGGGFHRYAVDEAWLVPHFEKMLYDQAQIAVNYLDARQATGDERYAWIARNILGYVLRNLIDPEGGFHTAEDADSISSESSHDGHATEGAFYVWTYREIVAALGAVGPMVCAHFGIAEVGNVPAALDPQGELRGQNVLAQRLSIQETARGSGLTVEQANEQLLLALARLDQVRGGRPRPHRDDKMLTATNGLMISALAKAHQVLGRLAEKDAAGVSGTNSYLTAAIRAAEFVYRELWEPGTGHLFRSWRRGRSSIEAFAEDYSFLIQGMLDLYEASFEVRWLQWAEQLQAKLDERFWDPDSGGYFNSRSDDQAIVVRLKDDYDGAEPAPNSVATMNLLRLATMLDDRGHRERARRILGLFQPQWSKSPQALPQMLCALELALEPPRHVVIAGDPAADDFRALVAVLHERIGPYRALLAADGAEGQSWLANRAPWIREMKPLAGRATAYVCEEYACHAPVSDPSRLRPLLARLSTSSDGGDSQPSSG